MLSALLVVARPTTFIPAVRPDFRPLKLSSNTIHSSIDALKVVPVEHQKEQTPSVGVGLAALEILACEDGVEQLAEFAPALINALHLGKIRTGNNRSLHPT